MSTDKAIGARVAAHRTGAATTQQELADAMRECGWSWVQPTVWSVEQGKRPIRLAEADDLATILGTNIQSLLSDAPATEYARGRADGIAHARQALNALA